MKKVIFALLVFAGMVITACSNDEEMEAAQFSATELQFSPNGETQTFKVLNQDLLYIMDGDKPAREDLKLVDYVTQLTKEWFVATNYISSNTTVEIKVCANTTGKERSFKLPVLTQRARSGNTKSNQQINYILIRQESK